MLISVVLVLISTPTRSADYHLTLQMAFILVAITAFFNLVVMILLVLDVAGRLLAPAGLIVDTFVAGMLLFSTGGAHSPLFYYLYYPILLAALRFSPATDALITIVLGAGCILLEVPPAELIPLIAVAFVSGILGTAIRHQTWQHADAANQTELQQLRTTREQARIIFEMASTLSATLNYQRILDAVLDVGILGLKEMGPASTRIVSLVLLLSTDEMVLATARHLSSRDEKLPLHLTGEGAVSQAINQAEPVVVNDPVHDSELTTYSSLHRCKTAVCVPLRAGFENYGAAIFASPDRNVFTPDNIDVLTAVCNQATIALQNAQLFESLQNEKARIVEIEEDARKKLARDLHDGPTQSVAAIAMRVNYARALLAKTPARVPEELEKIETLARATTKEIRQMLFTLRPLILETQGLKAALEALAQKIHETTPGLIVTVQLDPIAEKLDKDVQSMIFYVVEEAVGNARKHAEASKIVIRSGREGGEYVVEVRDNGKGFDVGKVQANYDKRGSLGMVNMTERAEVVKAKLSIASAAGQGTRVSLRFPVERLKI
jgi:signal transduction histidine kinase